MDQNTHSKTFNPRWAFFGSSKFSVLVLDALEKRGLKPNLIVTTPDKPRGRGLKVSIGEVREWADKREIVVMSPESLKNKTVVDELDELGPWDVFLIASYGKIVPADIFNMPKKGTLNIHPSLLPKLRGPTPIESAILSEKETGVTIMKIDEQVDHGDIIAQETVFIPVASDPNAVPNSNPEWPPYYNDLEKILAAEGARLFFETLPNWLSGATKAREQEHLAATFTKKFLGGGLRLILEDNPTTNLRKIRAFAGNRGVYFLQKHNDKEIRVIVTRAKLAPKTPGGTDTELVIERVIPEGKKEMNYEDFKRGLR